MARAKLQRGPDLLRLDDELLVDLGITLKLQRRAMLESLNQFRGRLPDSLPRNSRVVSSHVPA